MRELRLLLVLSLVVLLSCTGNSYSPKPRGYFNIPFPKKAYQTYQGNCPFSFDYPVYAKLETDPESDTQPCWYNLSFTQFNGRLHLTYYDVSSKKEYENLVEDARTFAFKHTVKANAIDQKLIN